MHLLFICSDVLGHAVFGDRMLAGLREVAPGVRIRRLGPGDLLQRDARSRWRYRLWASPKLPLPQRGRWSLRHRIESVLSSCVARGIAREIAGERFDLVHIHTQSLALRADRIRGCPPWIVSMDATSALLAREALRSGPASAHAGSMLDEARVLPRANRLVGWSEWVARSLVADYRCNPDRVQVIPPPVPLRLAAHRPSRRGSAVRALFVGNDFERKGGRVLLDAHARLPAGKLELDIVTNDPAAPPSAPGARFHRGLRAEDEELRTLYGQADFFVLPTLEDCYGIAFAEAMAAGLPPIGTDLMAVPRIVEHGRTGLVIPPSDPAALAEALLQLADDEELRVQMGEAARAHAASVFDIPVIARRWHALYRSLAG